MRLLLPLLLVTSVAFADEPVQAIRAKKTTCRPNGAIWLELGETDSAPSAQQSVTRLYANGAVTITRTRDKRSTTENADCLSPAEMTDVEALLKKGSWKPVEIKYKQACKRTSTTAMSVKVFDHPAVVERQCNKTGLDPFAAQYLAKVRAHLPSAKLVDCDTNPLAKGCL